jgi:hypothetical protein
MKSRRMRWAGLVYCMRDVRNASRIPARKHKERDYLVTKE